MNHRASEEPLLNVITNNLTFRNEKLKNDAWKKREKLLGIATGLKSSTSASLTKTLVYRFCSLQQIQIALEIFLTRCTFSINFQLIRRIVKVASVTSKINGNADGGHLVAVENLLGH